MKFNNQYINNKFIDSIIGTEKVSNSGLISDFKVLFNNEAISIKKEDFSLELFIGVPGYRIIETIAENSEISLKLSDEEIKHFEFEKNIKYYLNKENVVKVDLFNNNIWKIQMVEEIYWFTANPANFKTYFLNLLPE